LGLGAGICGEEEIWVILMEMHFLRD